MVRGDQETDTARCFAIRYAEGKERSSGNDDYNRNQEKQTR